MILALASLLACTGEKVTVCDSTASSSFGTIGEAVDAADLTGKTYDFDLATATWIEPTVGDTLVDYIAANHMLVMIESIRSGPEGKTIIDAIGAAGWQPEEKAPVEQYPCTGVAYFESWFLDNPLFRLGPQEFALGGDGFDVAVYDARLSGSFSADGSVVEDAHLEGLVDLRNVSAGAKDACTFLDALGAACVACPDGEVQCLESTVEWTTAPSIPGLTLDSKPSGKGC